MTDPFAWSTSLVYTFGPVLSSSPFLRRASPSPSLKGTLSSKSPTHWRACIDTHSLSRTATYTYTHISYAYIHILRYKFVDQYIFVIWIYTYTGIYSYTYKHTRIHTRTGGSMCQQHHKQQIRDRRQQKCNQV